MYLESFFPKRKFSILNISILLIFLAIIALFFLNFGCASTHRGKLVQSQNVFKSMLTTYNTEMGFQQDETVKQEWRETFPPMFEEGAVAIENYREAVQDEMDIEAKRNLFLLIKNRIISSFIRNNIEFKEK